MAISKPGPKLVTLKSANVTCSICNYRVKVGEQYWKVGVFNPTTKITRAAYRCVEHPFMAQDHMSEFALEMILIEGQIDKAADELLANRNITKFDYALQPIVYRLNELALENLTKYDNIPRGKAMHQRLLSRGSQLKELSEHLNKMVNCLKNQTLTVEYVAEHSPIDLQGID